jgi:hypothetical protein
MASPGKEYLVYFWGSKTGTYMRMNLPTGRYEYRWYDITSGKTVSKGVLKGSKNTLIESIEPQWCWGGTAMTIRRL